MNTRKKSEKRRPMMKHRACLLAISVTFVRLPIRFVWDILRLPGCHAVDDWSLVADEAAAGALARENVFPDVFCWTKYETSLVCSAIWYTIYLIHQSLACCLVVTWLLSVVLFEKMGVFQKKKKTTCHDAPPRHGFRPFNPGASDHRSTPSTLGQRTNSIRLRSRFAGDRREMASFHPWRTRGVFFSRRIGESEERPVKMVQFLNEIIDLLCTCMLLFHEHTWNPKHLDEIQSEIMCYHGFGLESIPLQKNNSVACTVDIVTLSGIFLAQVSRIPKKWCVTGECCGTGQMDWEESSKV